LSEPPKVPMAVRAVPTTTTSRWVINASLLPSGVGGQTIIAMIQTIVFVCL
jgi:hypothetical protein